MRILLDTNVLLDVLAQREPFYADSAAVWSLVETGVIEGYVSAISFNNIYYIVRRCGDRQKAHHAVSQLIRLFQVVSVDDRIIHRALALSIQDFEDAIQWASASEIGADRIITRNTRDFPIGSPVAISPAEFLRASQDSP